ncbi:S9 family peptidase [Cohaesibacter gelatinilyticus]|uniref:Oligopeptidase B Serine peptidase. MEROPS family S09A n=1 Tax=Cohaesibacter gelatinilyticus TaxID=372072 RepID=A0A285NHD5_9HYPH|nr:S9 family peptidase [Cohaesibacter gelatinilyticus]SNZ07071.1 oligopeptidase B Serine peptidase. MEROPS family S09A [Cohaesibacter gelatinilyticus]
MSAKASQAAYPSLAPKADNRPVIRTFHDIKLSDNYAWLRADNWQEVMQKGKDVLPADIRDYLEAENAYTSKELAHTEKLQADLFEEMKARIKEDDSSVPSPDGAFAYQSRYIKGGQYPLLVRTPRDGGEEEILLDGNKESEGQAFFRLAGMSHSPDHSMLAWAVDVKGSEYYEIHIRDLTSGKDHHESLVETTGSAVWSADSSHLYYTWLDDNHRPCKVFRHKLGQDQKDDELIHEETDPGFFVGLGKSQSGNHIIIDCHDHETSECYLIDARDDQAKPKLISARESGIEYSVDEGLGLLYILTNADGAEDFKLVTAPVMAPGRKNWVDLVPHQAGTLLLSHGIYRDYLTWMERAEGLPRIQIKNLTSGAVHSIAFDEEAYALGLSGSLEFDTSVIRFSYSSMTTPSRIYDYDMSSRSRTLRKEQEVPSGHVIEDYVTRRLHATSHDGEQVPITLLYRKDTPLDGSAPCLLYGYGSYGISIPASFSTNALSLVDRGFVYAIAHIRGGKEKGFAWYKNGKKGLKPNTFKDFIAAGNYLVENNFTSRGNIVAEGGSAGGMLMGAVANMDPGLFCGILALVPFVDVLNTMLDESLPLTPPEWPEWGNPIASKEDYQSIEAYSPYDRVSVQHYPAILAVGGLTDPRVTYWEPAKWVAKLREKKLDQNLLLLKINMDSGHAGASGRFDRLKETALEWAFALKVTGKLDKA